MIQNSVQKTWLSWKNDDKADSLQLTVREKDSLVLIMDRERIDEPIANMGPFVVNTQLELQAVEREYQNVRS